ncbi:hypothetical protein BGZ65_001241 [Modicella reniformis]|uniref:Uncharacterized protein n=1 Tax=Modicella reniformis TaxID=1440133 RepID=A0A9P6J467_9FUNG|nr:hypothetical protein BGZ65_001241 [Modicella reniformis]
MNEFFSQRQLKNALRPKPELPDIDDANIMKAVRLYLKGNGDKVEVPSMAGNKKLRIMLESLLEYLPLDEDNTISESAFKVKYVAPIIQAFVYGDEIISDFLCPNTNSTTQKQKNLRADRPDLRAKLSGQELLWGEITGPTQTGNKAKNLWDTYKLASCGKSFIIDGNDYVLLVQVIGSRRTHLRLYLHHPPYCPWRILMIHPNPFLDNNTDESDDDEQLDAAEVDENNGEEFLFPDKVDREFNFALTDGLDLATGFEPFFAGGKDLIIQRTRLCITSILLLELK